MAGEQRPAWLCTHRKLWYSDLEKGMCIPALSTGLRPSTSNTLVRKNMNVHAKELYDSSCNCVNGRQPHKRLSAVE